MTADKHSDSPKAPISKSPYKVGISWAGFALFGCVLISIWWHFSTRFYDQVLPFYDSASYQEGYRSIASLSQSQGVFHTLSAVWHEASNNVVLYRFYAAMAGSVFPAPREGLFIYLFSIHALAAIVMALAIYDITKRFLPAFGAVALYFLTTPFGLLRDGIGDQRMDLSSGSVLLIVTALGVMWVNKPSTITAALAGFATALAVLHRPILGPSLALQGSLFAGFALWQHRNASQAWWRMTAAALSPIVFIALPWLITHYQGLRIYYLEYGPSVGTTVTLAESIRYNWSEFWHSYGTTASIALVIAISSMALSARFNLSRAILIIACWLAPLVVLIISKSTGNQYVQQAALGIPGLLLAAWQPRERATVSAMNWDMLLALAILVIPVMLTPFQLARSLTKEPQHEREEVGRMLHQIPVPETGATIAGFHDLPLSPTALCMMARNEGVSLQVGTLGYYPSDFGLSNDYLSDVSSAVVQKAVAAKLALIKKQDDYLILPTADTAFRLWNGLYSHQLLPLIRNQVQHDPAFLAPIRIGPVKDVYFDLYPIRPRTS